jgi:hypothetical protein
MQQHWQTCNEAESSTLLLTWAPLIGGYPCIEGINIYCTKDDPRVGMLVQALLPIFIPDEKFSIEGY